MIVGAKILKSKIKEIINIKNILLMPLKMKLAMMFY